MRMGRWSVLSGRMAQDDIAELEALISSEARDRQMTHEWSDVRDRCLLLEDGAEPIAPAERVCAVAVIAFAFPTRKARLQ